MKPELKKEIEWAFPSSEWAQGHPKGCYVVTIRNDTFYGLKKAGFATWKEAKNFADTMPEKWGKYSISPDGMHAVSLP